MVVVLKTTVPGRVPGVRIPLPPPHELILLQLVGASTFDVYLGCTLELKFKIRPCAPDVSLELLLPRTHPG